MANIDEWAELASQAMVESIDVISDKIIDILQREIENQGIGEPSKNGFYQPTGEFKQAWKNKIANRLGFEVQGGMEYDPTKIITFDPTYHNYIHGATSDDPVNENFPDLIFDGKSGSFFGQGFWTQPRDAWSEMENYVDSNIDSWFDFEMNKRGFGVSRSIIKG